METDPHTENRRYPEQRRRRTSIDEPAPRTLDTSPTRSGYVTETGTTIVSLRSTDAVVVAADRRASLGGQFVTNKRLQKVEQLHPGAAIALSGTVGDIQQFVRTMRAEVRLYRHRRGDDLSMSALSTLAGTVLQRTRLRVMALLGGVDDAEHTSSNWTRAVASSRASTLPGEAGCRSHTASSSNCTIPSYR